MPKRNGPWWARIGVRMGIVALVLGALAACGGDRPGVGPDDPVTAPASPDTSPEVLEVEPREGLVDVRPHPWDEAEPIGPRTVRLEFYGGVEECEGVARVDVKQTKEIVTLTLFTGRVPSAEVCIEIAVRKAVTVELAVPLGGRELVDGAA